MAAAQHASCDLASQQIPVKNKSIYLSSPAEHRYQSVA